MLYRLRMLALVFLFAVGVVGLGACGSDACEDAADKIANCLGSSAGGGTGDCSGAAECAADCYNKASCDEIKDNFPIPNATSSLGQCIAACSQ